MESRWKKGNKKLHSHCIGIWTRVFPPEWESRVWMQFPWSLSWFASKAGASLGVLVEEGKKNSSQVTQGSKLYVELPCLLAPLFSFPPLYSFSSHRPATQKKPRGVKQAGQCNSYLWELSAAIARWRWLMVPSEWARKVGERDFGKGLSACQWSARCKG
jgi:hypothetical protein